MIIGDLIQKYRRSINPPYKRKDAMTILATLFILLAIPLTVLSVITIRNWQPKAAPSGPPRGVEGDLWADIIIGQPDFSEVSGSPVVSDHVSLARSVIIDRTSTPNKMYVYDGGHNRILGFDVNKCLSSTTNPLHCTADIVLGQPSMSTSACNGDSGFQNYPVKASASASSLCSISESLLSIAEGNVGSSMAVDSQGNLYVTDYQNNRVLKYNKPFETDTVADEVWGQSNFSGRECNKGMSSSDATSLCFTTGSYMAGVDIDASGNLWVADTGNHRILRFPPGLKTADLVIGQQDFTSHDVFWADLNSNGIRDGDDAYSADVNKDGVFSELEKSQYTNQFLGPTAVRVSPTTRKLYVADTGNNRVLVFTPPFKKGMSGQAFGSNFSRPVGIDFDPVNGVWIANDVHRVVELWDENNTKTREVGVRDNPNVLDGATGSIGIDSAGNIFLMQGRGGYSMALFRKGGPTDIPSYVFAPNTGIPNDDPEMHTAAKIDSATQGVAVSDNQLIVADGGRIMFWNDPTSLYTYKPADGAVGDDGQVSSLNKVSYGCCHDIKADKNHHLWVTNLFPSIPGKKHIEVYQLPLTNGAAPVKKIYFPLPRLGGGQVDLDNGVYTLNGIAPTPNGDFLWVTDSNNSRVFRIRDPLTNPVVDVVLGQVNATGTACNRGAAAVTGATADSLCLPGSLSLDRLGNLYVSDHSGEIRGNMRLLEFSKDLFPTNNTSVIYAPAASKIFPNHATFEAAFDSTNRMVVGFNPYWGNNPSPPDVKSPGNFPAVYNNPLGLSTTPDAFLKDFHSMSVALTFDDNDNLYVGDLNRSRVLIYKKPFGGGPSPKLGDLDGDGDVDILDLSKLITFWGATSGVADINKDGIVNVYDLSILLSNWGT